MDKTYTDLDPTPRLLLGPGPSMVHPRVLRVMATPLVGHLDPDFLVVMAEVKDLLRYVFQTENELTLAVPGTGTSAMEAALSNLLEPQDRMLVCINGYFGDRLADMGTRYGAQVERLKRPWGEVFDPDEIDSALQDKPAKVVALVHAETSTGALQPNIGAIAEVCHRHGGLLVLDCVTSLGGIPVEIDAWGVDIAYCAAQKALSSTPGMSPITVSPRAREIIGQRGSKPPVFYLDLTLLEKYWSDKPSYHHTAPISATYALREALRLVYEEGLTARFARHRTNAESLWKGLEALDLPLFIPNELRLTTLTTPRLPKDLDDIGLRRTLLEEFNIEIAGGFGPLAGQVWRIGLMGHSSQRENVTLLLGALDALLQ
ncbi:MAG: aminotransferase class V-fold PLP-dependent enzyme [Anaerolineales bacterium]|nr:aminotransferase class V-fold PLP-dependent enzyme [Anaerolineales bacterium]